MGLVPINIQINFNADYAGQHRACYRKVGETSYTCVLGSCVVGACQIDIPVFVDNETCTNVQYEGYVQPVCQDINSTSGRAPWALTFTPTPACQNYVVTCNSEGVESITITNGGNGYDPLNPPAVLFTGGSGSGAAGTAVVGFGAITSIAISGAGTGYVNGTHTNVSLTGGSGTGAKATVVVSGGVVISITVTTVGTAYLSTDVLGVNSTDMGGAPVVAATFTITSDYGVVNSITITNEGSGYTTAPNVTIAPPASLGTPATATAVLSACPDFIGNGCNGSPVTYPEGVLPVGSNVSVCSKTGPPVIPTNMSSSLQGNCLCSCTLATIGVSGPNGTTVRYFYNACNGALVTGLLTVGGSPSALVACIVTGSLVFQTITPGTIGTVSYGGACS